MAVDHREAIPSLGYMPAVDGLRAIAILGVVAFHAGIKTASGGFTGVDVFFVISGFLIIGQIRAALEAGSFSIIGFYARRAMRILPPYFVMLSVVALLAPFLLFVPKSYEAFAKAAVLAPLMVSNILFFIEQGYFDASVEQKPLIHTWTLSVEEQFYLVIPVALVLLFRFCGGRFGKNAGWIAGAAGLLSFIACVQFTSMAERNPAFYLTHLRGWEFIAGGLTLPLASYLKQKASAPVSGILTVFGLGLIATAFFGFDASDAFPGWRAAIPVLGAVLALAGTVASPRSPAATALSHPVPVRIGLLSYSWYLWHWPALSLASLAGIGADGWRGVFFGGIAGYFLAELSYRFVETPAKAWRFRRAAIVGDKKIFLAGVGSAFVLAAICGGVTGLGYLNNRAWLERSYGVTQNDRGGNCHVVTGNSLPAQCVQGKYLLLLGDSHADAVASVFADEVEKLGMHLVVIARGACDPAWFTPPARAANRSHRCSNLIAPIETVLAATEAPKLAIVVSQFNQSYSQDPKDVTSLAQMFAERGTATLFVGPVPVFDRPALECIVNADRKRENREDCAIAKSRFSPRQMAADALVGAGILAQPLSAYAPIGDVFCDEAVCRPWDGNTLSFWDTNHVLPAGAKKIFDKILPKLKEILAAQGAKG